MILEEKERKSNLVTSLHPLTCVWTAEPAPPQLIILPTQRQQLQDFSFHPVFYLLIVSLQYCSIDRMISELLCNILFHPM